MRVWPGASSHLHAGVEGRFTLKVIHDYAVITVDDVLVDALPAEMLQYFINAVDTIQNSLKEKTNKHNIVYTAKMTKNLMMQHYVIP